MMPTVNPRLLLAMLVSLGLGACTTPAVRDDAIVSTEQATPEAPEAIDEDQDNPFDTIAQAGASALHHDTDEGTAGTSAEPGPRLIWERFAEQFTFPQCTPGTPAHDWAVWYGKRQEYMDRVLTRAEPWLYDIAEQVAARQLPADLVLLPVVESAFDPFATSRGRAVGTWQFVRGTARDFGLGINDWYDGRRDVYAASRAALDYLQYLFTKFDQDWRLALAAYNGGQGRVERALKRYSGDAENPRPRDLRLPRETRSYAPKLHGLSCLMRDPAHYGLQLPEIYDKPQITAVEFDSPLDLIVAARLAQLDIAELYALNPGFSRWATPPKGPHRLVLPLDHAPLFEQAYAALPPSQQIGWQTVVVQSGDTLSAIAARTGVSVNDLMTANQLKNSLIRPGQELRLLGAAEAEVAPVFLDNEYQQQLASLQKLQGRLLPGEAVEHKVRSGESLWTIARRYQVSVKDLTQWNGISDPSRIRPGQTLRVAQRKNTSATQKLASNTAAGTQAAANSNAKHVLTSNASPIEYRVRRGDSPWTIARRHRLDVQDLLRWNNLNDKSVLRPGQTLRLSPASG